MALERGFRIIQLDECCVTKSTIPKATWSAKNDNHQLDFKQLRNEVKAILCAVSRENGLDFLDIYRHSITKIKFKLFLEGLRRKYPFDDILLIMDNLNLHKSNEVKDRMDELGFLYTYTPAYSPAFNGIEEVFSQAKLIIKKKRLHCLLNNVREDLR